VENRRYDIYSIVLEYYNCKSHIWELVEILNAISDKFDINNAELVVLHEMNGDIY
jgi:hypothetical protein